MNAALASKSSPRLADALLDPSCYPHPAQNVERLETHISWVFLAGDYAYKVKKPVRLPYLDFSSLADRGYFCREELRLNHSAAPDLYLDVVRIAGTPPRVGGEGTVREYAVRMRRFPQEALLDRLAHDGRLQPGHIDLLAGEIARLHREAAPGDGRSGHGTPEAIAAAALANFDELAAGGTPVDVRAPAAGLRAWTQRESGALAATFAGRRAAGFVRECHGDLHLGNVVLLDGSPRPFDCIEFSAALRWIDVMSDVAFLYMDLLHRGAPRLAYRFLDAYLSRTGDYAGLAVLRFYAVYRAMVRGKVALARGDEDELRRYVALAERLARREPPVVMLMQGFAASGKTTASQRLLEELGAVRLRSDVERKRLHGLAALERSRSAVGEGLYAAAATEGTYERLALLARQVLEAGYPVVVDATFLEEARRERFRALATELGAACEIVRCVAPEQVLRERIGRRLRTGDDASEAHAAVLERQLARHDPLTDEERMHSAVLDTTRDPEWRGAVSSLARRFRMPLAAR